MIGIVAVSHSVALAEAAVALALEMTPGGAPPVRVAAGAGEGVTGTDATRVAGAIDELVAAGAEGVLVVMDLGSALLSAELALEFVAHPETPVRLSAAPFVEGLLAAVVRAAGGGSLDEVAAEAEGALRGKSAQLGGPESAAADERRITAGSFVEGAPALRLALRNPLGLHARPASQLASALGPAAASVEVRLVRTGATASLASPTALLALGARGGDELELRADPSVDLSPVRELVEGGFGELDAPPPAPPEPAPAGPLGVSPGRAVGPVRHLAAPAAAPAEGDPVPEPERAAEAERIPAAAAEVAAALRERAARARERGRAAAADILAASAAIAEDPGLIGTAQEAVRADGLAAPVAIRRAADRTAEALAAAGGRTAERAGDVRDVRDRLVARLLGVAPPGLPEGGEPYVLVARDLAPADTAELDPARCLALVTEEGGPTSHTAIIARSLGIPAVVAAVGALGIPEGTTVLVDGELGRVVADPSEEERAAVRATTVAEFSGRGALADGTPIPLLANVGGPDDAAAAAAARAEGVGLFRTEFGFLGRETAPSRAEQVEAYRRVLAAFPGRPVVIRTLDAGADKPLPFVTAEHEENPALGVRGLRTARRHPEVLDDQLAAIAEAAAAEGADARVMAPMVATAEEAGDFAARCRAAGIGTVGVMIETPAAALCAAELFRVVDFASLGTNDLAQYTMAADRQVGELAGLADAWQPAVLRLIREVGAAGAAAGRPVGVCGEAASDPLLAVVLVGLGATSLSMTPRALPAVAARLATVDRAVARTAAEAAASAASASAARAAVRALLPA